MTRTKNCNFLQTVDHHKRLIGIWSLSLEIHGTHYGNPVENVLNFLSCQQAKTTKQAAFYFLDNEKYTAIFLIGPTEI